MRTKLKQVYFILSIIIFLAWIQAQGQSQSTNPPTDHSKASVGTEFQPMIGQETNAISARRITWKNSSGLELTSHVIYDRGARRMVAASELGNILYLKGRYFSFIGSAQRILVIESKPSDAIDFSEQAAIEFAQKSGFYGGEIVKVIDVSTVLKPQNKFSSSIPMVFDMDVKLKTNQIVIYFSASKTEKGKVILDEQLNVVSLGTEPK